MTGKLRGLGTFMRGLRKAARAMRLASVGVRLAEGRGGARLIARTFRHGMEGGLHRRLLKRRKLI